MTERLTRGRGQHYRSHIGTDNVPMSLRQGLSKAKTPDTRRVLSPRVFLWLSGGLSYSPLGAVRQPTPSVGSWRSPSLGHQWRPPSAPVTDYRNRLARSTAMP